MTETPIEKAKRQYEQAKARLHSARARQSKLERKRDTRRKVILGGALIELASRDKPARSMMRQLIRNRSREQDRKMFDLAKDLPTSDESDTPNDPTAHTQTHQPVRTAGDTRHG